MNANYAFEDAVLDETYNLEQYIRNLMESR